MTVTELDTLDIALAGVGKIARDQHIPAIAGHPGLRLAATSSRSGGVAGVENHEDFAALLAARPDIPAVSLCMPPQVRHGYAVDAIRAGRHVMLEKPPGASVSEVLALKALAEKAGVTLFATWHSRHAAGVAAAKAWLADKTIRKVQITWKEDVRHWHPGQDWIWEPGGLGVFDPGINALSILTEILPAPVHLSAAELTFPENRAQPIAAALRFAGEDGLEVAAEFDWRQTGPQSWDIAAETDAGRLTLSEGGAKLAIDDVPQGVAGSGEYPDLYRRFAELIAAGQSDVDVAPLLHVADAFLMGRRLITEPFHD
ncbi:Gfo/Idh/MocA family protein [Poseidonocella sp. HB161398]|uniref:Gfo/Idh/MocA family protein n=1 Tax=Poseidonocella sp. HB161398 TaxID=2320855 RepID=UPI001108D5FF|nr:Gfo/Idh/MocA family oxidoreductase [Poseidonocella sp. HB161398]